MFDKYRLEVIAALVVLGFALTILVAGSWIGTTQYQGSDDRGTVEVANITGTPKEAFTPLVSLWEPPGSEVQTGIFALAAGVGGIVAGFAFGFWAGARKKGE